MNIFQLFSKSKKKSISRNELIIQDWIKSGRPAPPPHLVKQQMISSLQQRSGYQLFVESGTYLGAMVEAQKSKFRKIYSIELGEFLHRDAVKLFEKDTHIEILCGDSGDVLVELIKSVKEPAIFWLDGHYSAGITAMGKKECPIYEELQAIFSGDFYKHIILIDDARLFTGANDYPTQNELLAFIHQHRPEAVIENKNDSIQVFI